jgi:activator of 2-hydroxyglutaryl-CoA dehydratase
VGREEEKAKRGGGAGLAKDDEDLAAFKAKYRTKKFHPTTFRAGEVVEGFVGIDGGSTSTKAVLISKDHKRRILAKTYQLSKGNPIEDTVEVLQKLDRQVRDQGAELKILGVGTTGYAKDILKDVVGADAALVETVAHTEAGLHFYDNVDVICDVGGQDIKIIILKNGRVKDFKLNTQCSAGNGYFLQSTAQGFNVPVEQYADTAFGAKGFPQFGYGCAVFMQSDIVDFQRQGWKPEEIMAGPVQRAAQEHLALRLADSQLIRHRHALPAAGWHAVQPGRGEGPGGFHRVALQGQGHARRCHRTRALRRSRRHRRGA